MHPTLKVIPFAVLAVFLAGCGGDSLIPGQGGSGGLGTPRTGTGNPDATLSFRLRGSKLGDFDATDVKSGLNVLGFQVQGTESSGPDTGRITRVATMRFNGLPVDNHDYTVGGADADGAVFQYTEKNVQTGQAVVWNGTSGTIHVTRVTFDHVDATFDATLSPGLNTSGTLSVSGGELQVKYG